MYNENSSANFYEANSGELKKGCEVIGILEKNSQISLNMTYCLDKMIVMPFVTFPASSKLTDGQIIHYANYTSGVVEIPADRFTTDLKQLKDVLNQKSFGDYSYAIQQQFFSGKII